MRKRNIDRAEKEVVQHLQDDSTSHQQRRKDVLIAQKLKRQWLKDNLNSPKFQGDKKKPDNSLFNNISHKNSFGCSNWNKFTEKEGISSATKMNNSENKLPFKNNYSRNENSSNYISNENKRNFSRLNKSPGKKPKITQVIGLDCEMVGIGENGSVSMLARVSMVNSFGECIMDKYVQPIETVTDYRTFVSGIRPHHILNGEDFFKVQKEVAFILKGKILVGHALKHDLEVLMLRHPRKFIRDTTTCLKFRREAKGTLSLKNLAKEFLNVNIQNGEHDSVEDAKAAMQLYMTYRKEWEKEILSKWSQEKQEASKKNFRYPVLNVDCV